MVIVWSSNLEIETPTDKFYKWRFISFYCAEKIIELFTYMYIYIYYTLYVRIAMFDYQMALPFLGLVKKMFATQHPLALHFSGYIK